jgi:predicted porin
MGDADVTGFGATSSVGSVWSPTNALGPSRTGLIRYTFPTLTQGLDIVVEHSNGADSSGSGTGDSTGAGISYTTGGLYVKYAVNQTKTNSGITSFDIYDGAGKLTVNNNGSTSLSVFDGSTANYQALAFTYDLGVAKLYYGNQQMNMNDSGDAAESKWTAGVSVPFGSASVGYGHSSAQFTNAAGANSNLITSDAILLKYSFSKRTLAYLKAAKSSTDSTSASISNTSLGLVHNF